MAASPVNPVPAAPAAPPPSEHGAIDRISNKLSAAMTAKAATPGTPAPGPVNPPLATPAQPAAPAPPAQAAPPATPVDTPPAEDTSFDLENFDFDNPPEDKPVDTPPADGAAKPEEKTLIPDGTLEQQLAQMLEKGEVPEQIEAIFLKHSRGRQMLSSFKIMRELAKPASEGGIGRIPTVEEIKNADATARINGIILDEFRNMPQSFAFNLFRIDPQHGGNYFGSVENVKQFVTQIPTVLRDLMNSTPDPNLQNAYREMYTQYSAPVLFGYLDHQYKIAMAMPGQRDANGQPDADMVMKARWLDALQLMEYRLTGKARALDFNNPNAPAGPAGQPSAEVQDLQRRLQIAETQNQERDRQFVNGIVANVEGNAKTGILSDIDAMFKAARLSVAYSPDVLEAVRDTLFQQALAVAESHDPTGINTYKQQVRQATRGQLDPSIPAQTFRNIIRGVFRGNSGLRERMTKLVNGAKGNLDAQTARLEAGQASSLPSGTGVLPRNPQATKAAAELTREPGETTQDFVARRIRTASQLGLPAPRR